MKRIDETKSWMFKKINSDAGNKEPSYTAGGNVN
jgi:hypothetical protein